MKITEKQLRAFNENFKLCLAQTTTTFYSMNEYLELDDFESRKMNELYIDDYQPTSSDIDHEIYSIETEQGVDMTLITKKELRNRSSLSRVVRLFEYYVMEV